MFWLFFMVWVSGGRNRTGFPVIINRKETSLYRSVAAFAWEDKQKK